MKLFAIFAVLALCLSACTEDDNLGEVMDLEGTSLIPQGKADASTENRIMGYYDKFGTYFLYDFTPEEATWSIVSSSSDAYSYYTLKPANLDYISGALDLLEETFLNLHEPALLKQMLPLKVFLADSIKTSWSTYNILSTSSSFIIGNMGKSATTLTETQRYAFSKDLNDALIKYMISSGKLQIPEAFYAVSNYSLNVSTGTMYGADITHYQVSSPSEAALNAGFLCAMQSWQGQSAKQVNDVVAYLQFMLYIPASSNEWNRLFSYPLVKKKYDILHKAILEENGFDMQHKNPIIL